MKFRFKALQRLREPDELDTLLRLSRPRTWLAAWTVAALLLSGITWAAADTIPRLARGQGLLTHPLGVSEVQSQLSGVVVAVPAVNGGVVNRGDPLVQVSTEAGAVVKVLAPFPGRVISLVAGSGQVLQRGSTVATIERTDAANDRLLALVVVPTADAKTIRPGAAADLTVSTAQPQAFGVLRGEVFSVGALPLSPEEFRSYFGQAALVSRLGHTHSYVLVTIDLVKDKGTVSGYRWSTRKGPPFGLDSQIEVSTRITVAREHPISLVLNG